MGRPKPITNANETCIRCNKLFREKIPLREETHLTAWARSVDEGEHDSHWIDDEDAKYLAGYLSVTESLRGGLLILFNANDPDVRVGIEDAKGDLEAKRDMALWGDAKADRIE